MFAGAADWRWHIVTHELRPCPICGAKAETTHLAAPWQGIDMGWMCGCTRFSVGDKLHERVSGERALYPMIHDWTKEDAEVRWNLRAGRIKSVLSALGEAYDE